MTNIIYPSSFVVVDVLNNQDNSANWLSGSGPLTGAYIFGKLGTNIVLDETQTLLYKIDLNYNPLVYPTSGICFTKGNKVLTNLGYVNIETIDPEIHTVNNHEIKALTITKYMDKVLVKIKKNALGRNKPNQDTYITSAHCLYHRKKMIPARKLVPDFASFVEYSGEPLYNILLKYKGIMKVNNLVAETLNPENATAKYFIDREYLTANERETYIRQHDEFVAERFLPVLC